MEKKKKILTRRGKFLILWSSILFASLIATICLIISVHKEMTAKPAKTTKAIQYPRECPLDSLAEIMLSHNKIIVDKEMFFCNPIGEKQIPEKTLIRLNDGRTIIPSKEDATTAEFPVDILKISRYDWQIIADTKKS